MNLDKKFNSQEETVATPRKVEEYLIATEAETNYLLVIQGTLQQLSLDLLCRGDREGAYYAQMQSKLQDRLRAKIVDLVRKLFGELFTDQDLDQLIAIYQMPASKKMRESLPIMQREVLNLFETINLRQLAQEASIELQ